MAYVVHGTNDLCFREDFVVYSELVHLSVIIIHGPIFVQQVVIERPFRVISWTIVLIASHFGLSNAVLLHVTHTALAERRYLLLTLIDVAEHGNSHTIDVNHHRASSENSGVVMPRKMIPAKVRIGRERPGRLASDSTAVSASKMPFTAEVTTPKLG